MKICVVVNKFVRGMGITEYLYGLCNELSKKHDLILYAPVISGIDAKYARSIKESRLPQIKYFLPYSTKRLPKFDVVISNYPTIAAVKTGAKIAKKQKIPHIIIDYGIAEETHFKNLRARIAHWLINRSMYSHYSKADKVLSISEFLRSYVRKIGLDSEVIWGGIKCSEFQEKYETGILEKLGVKEDGFAFFVGRMSPHKGVHLVVEALNKIGFPIIFVVDGGHSIGDYAEEVKRKGGKKLILTDVLKYTERNELYQKCMFYVTGSQWEGLNLTLLEAQASGKSVIAFDLCAHPEVVGPKSGFLVKDTKEMAAKMKKLIEDKKLRQEMGKEGKKFAKKFDWPIIAKNVEKDIAKVMK